MDLALKRVVDIVGSLFALLLFGLPMAVLALLVRVKLGSPVLFKQDRPGKHGKVFKMVKFRTMRNATDKAGRQLPDDERMTPFGAKLRAMSLDELPEFFNVLRGQMSLVGPRPLLVQYLDRYSTEQARRHEVKPGATGWAQVNGRNAISWDEKFALDVWYVDHRNIWLDFKIMWMTVIKVFKREGVSAAGVTTMTEFMGSAKEQTTT